MARTSLLIVEQFMRLHQLNQFQINQSALVIVDALLVVVGWLAVVHLDKLESSTLIE